MPSVTIHIGKRLNPLEQRAVKELQHYSRTLFGCVPEVSRCPLKGERTRAGHAIVLGTRQSNSAFASFKPLAEQEYIIRRRSAHRLDICGGSPVAVLWGAYEVIEHWGVSYLVQGDVLPDLEKVGPFRFPKLDVHRKPVFETRAARILGDMINTMALGSLADHERLFDQLCKLRFNAVVAGGNSFNPWYHWSYRGLDKKTADITYGFRHVIHQRSIGREVIGRLGHYTNPDLQGAETYEEKLAAGKRLLHGIIEAAHKRGIRVIVSHTLSDFPEEIQVNLPRWSQKHRIPPTSMTRDHFHTLGLQRDGTAYRFGHLMTPLNPVYVDMVESILSAFIGEYPDMDGWSLTGHEWPPGAGGIEECWCQLDRRHGLSPEFTYEKLIKKASRLKISGSADRAVHAAQGAIATSRLLDLILNERKVISRILSPNVKLYGGLNETLMPVLPRIFDSERLEFVASMDVLPSDVERRSESLAFAANTGFKTHLVTVINDDNTGFIPQFTTKILHKTVRAMRKYGLVGYRFRLYDMSKYEPIMGYMAETSWDRTATPKKTYTRQIERICGEAAVEPIRKAYMMLENCMDDVDASFGTGFMMPTLMTRFWHGFDKSEAWKRLIKKFGAIAPLLEQGVELSEPRGKQYAGDMLAFVRFAQLYLEMALCVLQAGRSYSAVHEMKRNWDRKEPFDMDICNQHYEEAVQSLDEALGTLEQATHVWADTVRDASDLGSLIGLNVYGLDWLRGKADEIRLESELWSM